MRHSAEEKLFDQQQEDHENEAAKFLLNLRSHGFASSNEQFGFALGQLHGEEASPAIEEE